MGAVAVCSCSFCLISSFNATPSKLKIHDENYVFHVTFWPIGCYKWVYIIHRIKFEVSSCHFSRMSFMLTQIRFFFFLKVKYSPTIK